MKMKSLNQCPQCESVISVFRNCAGEIVWGLENSDDRKTER